MAKIWEINQGHSEANEDKKYYARFRDYLKLGPRRSHQVLADKIGVTRQAISIMAKKYNWKERADAWDREKNKKENGVEWPVVSIPPEKPRVLEEITQAIQSEVLTTEVLETNEARLQYDKWFEYQERFCILGKEMLDDADKIRQLALLCHEDLEALWRTRLKALEAKDFTAAKEVCTQIKDITPQYHKLRELVRGHRQDARLHWGDAIGVKAILEAAYKPKKEQ